MPLPNRPSLNLTCPRPGCPAVLATMLDAISHIHDTHPVFSRRHRRSGGDSLERLVVRATNASMIHALNPPNHVVEADQELQPVARAVQAKIPQPGRLPISGQAHEKEIDSSVGIVYEQFNYIYGNNTKLTIANGPEAHEQVNSRRFTSAKVDRPDPRDVITRWHRTSTHNFPGCTVYNQENCIYGDNRRLIIANGDPFHAPPNETAGTITYKQSNWIYGDNTHLKIINGDVAPDVQYPPALNLQTSWVCGTNRNKCFMNGSENIVDLHDDAGEQLVNSLILGG